MNGGAKVTYGSVDGLVEVSCGEGCRSKLWIEVQFELWTGVQR